MIVKRLNCFMLIAHVCGFYSGESLQSTAVMCDSDQIKYDYTPRFSCPDENVTEYETNQPALVEAYPYLAYDALKKVYTSSVRIVWKSLPVSLKFLRGATLTLTNYNDAGKASIVMDMCNKTWTRKEIKTPPTFEVDCFKDLIGSRTYGVFVKHYPVVGASFHDQLVFRSCNGEISEAGAWGISSNDYRIRLNVELRYIEMTFRTAPAILGFTQYTVLLQNLDQPEVRKAKHVLVIPIRRSNQYGMPYNNGTCFDTINELKTVEFLDVSLGRYKIYIDPMNRPIEVDGKKPCEDSCTITATAIINFMPENNYTTTSEISYYVTPTSASDLPKTEPDILPLAAGLGSLFFVLLIAGVILVYIKTHTVKRCIKGSPCFVCLIVNDAAPDDPDLTTSLTLPSDRDIIFVINTYVVSDNNITNIKCRLVDELRGKDFAVFCFNDCSRLHDEQLKNANWIFLLISQKASEKVNLPLLDLKRNTVESRLEHLKLHHKVLMINFDKNDIKDRKHFSDVLPSFTIPGDKKRLFDYLKTQKPSRTGHESESRPFQEDSGIGLSSHHSFKSESSLTTLPETMYKDGNWNTSTFEDIMDVEDSYPDPLDIMDVEDSYPDPLDIMDVEDGISLVSLT